MRKRVDQKAVEKLAEFIETKVPKKAFDMRAWSRLINGEVLSRKHTDKNYECGMTACLGGWAALAFPRRLQLRPSERYCHLDDSGSGVLYTIDEQYSDSDAFAVAFGFCWYCAEEVTDPSAPHQTPKGS